MLTISGLAADYYNAHPTLSTMRGRSLGQLAALPPDELSKQLAVEYRRKAAELGVKLPARPANATRGQSQVLDTLEAIDLTGAYLSRIAQLQFKRLAEGGAICEDLNRYNQLALGLYELERDLLAQLRDGGVQGVPLTPPWPPLFLGVGSFAAAPSSSVWELDCKSPIVTLASSTKPDGVQIAMSKPCDAGLGEITTGTVIVLVTGALLLADLVEGWLAADVDKERVRSNADAARRSAELIAKREGIIDRRKDECVKKGGDYATCLKAAYESVFDMTDVQVANEPLNRRGGGGKSWLWYIGFVAVVVGGIVIYKKVTERRGQRIPRAEIIEA